MHMLNVPAVQSLQLFVIMTEVTSCQVFETVQNIMEISQSKYCNCSKIYKDLTYLIFLQVKELESAKLINLWLLLKQTKAEAQAGLAGVNLDRSPLINLD